jgi:hypothetical protein
MQPLDRMRVELCKCAQQSRWSTHSVDHAAASNKLVVNCNFRPYHTFLWYTHGTTHSLEALSHSPKVEPGEARLNQVEPGEAHSPEVEPISLFHLPHKLPMQIKYRTSKSYRLIKIAKTIVLFMPICPCTNQCLLANNAITARGMERYGICIYV